MESQYQCWKVALTLGMALQQPFLQGNIIIDCTEDPYNPVVHIVVSLPTHFSFLIL
jgi:hypothetical protein